MTLSGAQIEQFRDALCKAFPDYSKLKQMVRTKLEFNLDDICASKALKDAAFDLIDKYEAESNLEKLLDAALQANSSNNELLKFEEQIAKSSKDILDNQENIRKSILNYNFKEKIDLIDEKMTSKFNIFFFDNYHAHEALFIVNRYAKTANYKLITLKFSVNTRGLPPGLEFIDKKNLLVFIYIGNNTLEDGINDLINSYKSNHNLNRHKSVLLFFISEINGVINYKTDFHQISDCNLIKELKTIEELKKEFVIWYNKENCGENIDEKTINCFCDSNINLKTSFNEKDKFSFNLLKNFALQHLKYEIDFDDNLNLKLNPC